MKDSSTNNIKEGIWTITQDKTSQPSHPSEFVMTWAKDIDTHEPKYIFELDENRRGANSRCICYSCGMPLTAVNAAKSSWKTRPHFRHPDGTKRNDCLILTARAAALQMLRNGDLVLPARGFGKSITGISGKEYKAWTIYPPEKVSIKNFHLIDEVSAILKLDNGREILVKITGSINTINQETTIPIIKITIDDPELAALSPSELKSRLHLLVEQGTWCGTHWRDESLENEALLQAQTAADKNLDWATEMARQELGESHSNESLLHWLAKEILLAEKIINVPKLVAKNPEGMPFAFRDEVTLQLTEVKLEKSISGIRPDVIARYFDPRNEESGEIMIEVTVTNKITPERIEKISKTNLACLEININELGGKVNKQEFSEIITRELAAKKWLHHPWIAEKELLISNQLNKLRDDYLEAVKQHSNIRTNKKINRNNTLEEADLLAKIVDLAEKLKQNGITGAERPELFKDQGCILDRILSIRQNKVVGYRLNNLWDVINAIKCERDPAYLQWHTVYLIALKKYKPEFKMDHKEKIEYWRAGIIKSLTNNEPTYNRSRDLDKIIGFLFPEMKDALNKPLPRKNVATNSNNKDQKIKYQHKTVTKNNWWLDGEELEDWKAKNPESAKIWEQSLRNK